MNYKWYDYNVWSQCPNELCLTAYEWEYDPKWEQLQTNTRKFHTIRFVGLESLAEIEFLTGEMWLNSYPLTDYDTWADYIDLYTDKTPKTIKDFLEGLPAYDVPAMALGAFDKENA